MIQTTILVKDYRCACLMGINDDEQERPQQVLFTVEVTLKTPAVVRSIDETLNYDRIIGFINDCSKRHINLVETFAADITNFCMADAHTTAAVVQVEKLEMYEGAKVGARVSAAI